MTNRKLRNLFLVIGGIGFGGVVTGLIAMPSRPMQSATYAQQAATAEQAKENLLVRADELSNAFREVAKAVRPSVVSITATKRVSQRTVSPFRGRELPDGIPEELRRFFNDNAPLNPRAPSDDDAGSDFDVPAGIGSGVIISSDGYIVTNNHVVADADNLKVALSDGRELPVEKVVGTDAKSDLAVLKVNATGLVATSFGDSEAMEVGDWVVAIGSPFGLAQTVTQGIVSAKNRTDMSLTAYDDFLQTDAAINPGNSGGPLLNLRGEVIGINTAIASRSGSYNGIGFAIPSNKAKRAVDSLIRNGRVVRGFLGLELRDVDSEVSEKLKLDAETDGALVASVLRDGPGAKAGLKPNDLVTAVDGRKVNSVAALRLAIAETSPGSVVKLSVIRSGKSIDISATVEEQTDEKLAMMGPAVQIPGLQLEPNSPELAAEFDLPEDASGLVVTGLSSTSMLASMLELGDLIEKVNGKEVASMEEFSAAMVGAKTLSLEIRNSTGTRSVNIRLAR